MAFAAATDLKTWLQADVIDTAAATLALDVATDDIRTYCGWSITQETGVTAVLDGTDAKSLWLPTLKLTAVASVVVAGVTLTQGTDYDWTGYGKLIRRGRWPCTPRSVTITYTHGYATVPDAVKGVCLALAARRYENPTDARSITNIAGPFHEDKLFEPTSGLVASLFDVELERLGKYKLEELG